MKQKITIEVPMNCERCKSKAMKTAASQGGVRSVTIEFETNKMVVIGDGVDPVCLTASLRKKFAYANIVTVEKVKPRQAEAAKDCVEVISGQARYDYSNRYRQCDICYGACECDAASSNNCALM